MSRALYALVAVLAGAEPAPKAAPTRCEACHTPQGWERGAFDHSRTGYPLGGAHARVTCRYCHAAKFSQPVPTTCSGCHKDPHVGELGARCSGCHDETSWKSRFDADAHRRTNFPLVGRHAALPCEECHGEMRERRFSRPAVECMACHSADFARTAATQIDHVRLGLGEDCRSCHSGFRFKPARFPSHDLCFPISSGKHVGIGCNTCHVQLPSVSMVGQCAQRSTACSGCHEHACSKSDPLHAGVLGYECRDRKCYDCHRLRLTP